LKEATVESGEGDGCRIVIRQEPLLKMWRQRS
jgi:hypothetical protein